MIHTSSDKYVIIVVIYIDLPLSTKTYPLLKFVRRSLSMSGPMRVRRSLEVIGWNTHGWHKTG